MIHICSTFETCIKPFSIILKSFKKATILHSISNFLIELKNLFEQNSAASPYVNPNTSFQYFFQKQITLEEHDHTNEVKINREISYEEHNTGIW